MSRPDIRLLFFGTSGFAVSTLKKLKQTGYNIAAMVTQPDKPAGRRQEPLPSPVKAWAEKNGIKVLQPEKLNPPPPPDSLRDSKRAGNLPHKGGRNSFFNFPPLVGGIEGGVDLFIVASYGKIIPKEILEIPKYGALNIHPSLLPKYRGPSPIQTTILNGDKETGVTIIKMDEEMDHGPIVGDFRFNPPTGGSDLRLGFKELHDKLAELGAELLIETLPKYISGEIKPRPQDHSKATFTKIITKEDARIDWSRSAEEVERQVRAFEVWPVAWTMLDGKRLKIYSALPLPRHGEGGPPVGGPGEVAANNKLIIQTGSDVLEILELQLEGSRRMPARDFLNGNPGLSGKILI